MCIRQEDGTILVTGNDDGTGIWSGECEAKYTDTYKPGDCLKIRICTHTRRTNDDQYCCLDCHAVYLDGKWREKNDR